MKSTILTLALLLVTSNTLANQLTFVSKDGIKVFGRNSVERTLNDGHCRQDENPYSPDSPPDFCNKGHIDAYRDIIENQEINFAGKYILALIYQDPKDEISKDKKNGNTIKLTVDSHKDLVVIDPKTKSVYTLYLAVKGKIEFSKTTNYFTLEGSVHAYRMASEGTYRYYFGVNHFDSDDDSIGFYTHPCGADY